MTKVILFGECMVELVPAGHDLMKSTFAGDVYNTGVYMHRTNAGVDVQLLSAVGAGELSDAMLQRLHVEGVGTDFMLRSTTRQPGIYMVHTDDSGERSFSYWRSQSAARHTLRLLQSDFIERLDAGDYFFYSGISLAVIEPEDRPLLWPLLQTLRNKGVKVVFDPNYRPVLWASQAQAAEEFKEAFHHCDILLPGIEDFDALYGVSSLEDICALLAPTPISELVIKNGPESVYWREGQAQLQEVSITPAQTVVDTTSAGDSFNGGFLSARLSGKDIASSIRFAASIAAEVIQHPGAIVDKVVFSDFLADKKLG